jgi:hypothetical protein
MQVATKASLLNLFRREMHIKAARNTNKAQSSGPYQGSLACTGGDPKWSSDQQGNERYQ